MTFLKILFFSGWIAINSEPIDIGRAPLTLEAPEPLDVVTSGAHLTIDVSNMVNGKDLFEIRDELEHLFPNGCVVAIMSGEDVNKVIFDHQGSAVSNDSVKLTLSAKNGVSTDSKFSKVTVSSCQPIVQTTVIWVNFKH